MLGAGSKDMDIDLGSDLKATAEEKKKGDKVCVMLRLDCSIAIFMLNLDKDPVLNENGFEVIKPNLQVVSGILPHVVKDALYLFDDHTDARRHIPPRVYTIKLQKVSDMVGRRVVGAEEVRTQTDQFTRLPDCLGPKPRMRSLSYRDSILVFSTEIDFHHYDDLNGDKYVLEEYHTLKDFELYNPGKGESRLLPQLIVCLPRHSGDDRLKLYDSVNSKYYDHDFPAFESYSNYAFSIVSFGVDVEEDLDAFGANDFRARWLKQQQEEQSRLVGDDANKKPRIASPSHSQGDERAGRVAFPPFLTDIERHDLVSGYGRDSSAFDFLKLEGDPPCTLCIVRQAFGPICKYRVTSDDSYFFLDVLELDLQNLEKELEFSKEEFLDSKDYSKFMKQIKSFKYHVPGEICTPFPFVQGVFYY